MPKMYPTQVFISYINWSVSLLGTLLVFNNLDVKHLFQCTSSTRYFIMIFLLLTFRMNITKFFEELYWNPYRSAILFQFWKNLSNELYDVLKQMGSDVHCVFEPVRDRDEGSKIYVCNWSATVKEEQIQFLFPLMFSACMAKVNRKSEFPSCLFVYVSYVMRDCRALKTGRLFSMSLY